MARTTPAQKPRGEHSNTRSGGLLIESVAVGGIMGIASLGCPNSPYAKWAASAGPVKLRQRHVRDIGQRGRNCIYSVHFPSSSMTTASPDGRAKRRGDFAMTSPPLMPKATAVWLVENTALSFDQIADFCKLHPLEVKAIADGDAAQGIKGLDPVLTGQLTREEIEKAEGDPEYRLKILDSKVRLPEAKRKKGPRYTPVSRRQDRPNAILWLVRNHPELKDSQIMRLVGTTKSTIQAIRERTHWNASNLQPMHPVTLGLCSQIDLDLEVHRAAKEKPVDAEAQGATLLPASETTIRREPEPEEKKPADELNVDAVFAKLKQLGGKSE